MELIDEFEAARPRLLSLAHRMLGSLEDAEDAVQSTWLRAQAATTSTAGLRTPAAWLTTVTARLCLDKLRSRERRAERPLLADTIRDERLAADEEFLLREDVSRALMVMLDRLTPAQRAAYTLHDLFGVPFADVAVVLDTTPPNAKKLASRARQRLVGAGTGSGSQRASADHERVVDAFLSAARGGDLDALVALMAPDVVRVADPAVLPEGGQAEVAGGRAVAEDTQFFIERVNTTVAMRVNGAAAAVIAPGGHPLAAVYFTVERGRIARIAIEPLGLEDVIAPR